MSTLPISLRPIGHKILVEKEPYKPTIEGGILIPQKSDNTPSFSPTIRGVVLAVGGKVTCVKPGDKVALKRVAGDEIEVDGKLLTLCIAKELVGSLE